MRRLLLDDGWLELGCILFSQYYDSAYWLAEQLSSTLPDEPVGIYAGAGRSGLMQGGAFQRLPRDTLKAQVRDGEIRLLIGLEMPEPWLCSFVTCAAPYAPGVGQPLAGDLLCARIHRVLAIARAHGYRALVLGAWGCGAFGNDPERTARDFRGALTGPFAGVFSDVVFAVTDWSPQRRILGPFRALLGA